MDVELTADQRAFVRRAIESGRFAREEEAVQEAMALWEDRSADGSKSSPWLTKLKRRWHAVKGERSPKNR